MCHIRKTRRANSDCEAPQKTRKNGRGFPNVARRENRGGSSRVVQSAQKESPKCADGIAVEGSPLLGIIEVVGGGVVEDFVEIAGGFEAGHREVHHQVIAAVTGTGTWDWAVKLGDEGEGLAHKRQYISTLQVSLDDEVIAGEAAHGSPIDYPFAPLAVVSQEGGGKVLYGVDRIWMEHRLPVGLLHPDIKCGHYFRAYAVLSRNENSAFQSEMVNCKTRNLLHMLQKF